MSIESIKPENQAAKKILGRPSVYTIEIAAEICERLASGETLRNICRSEHMPDEATVRGWALDNRENFFPHYTRARDIGMDVLAEELFDIADDGANDYMERVTKSGEVVVLVDSENIQRSKLRVETRKWYLSKLAPKKYGDSTILRGDKDNPLDIGLAQLLEAASTKRELLPTIDTESTPVLDMAAIEHKTTPIE